MWSRSWNRSINLLLVADSHTTNTQPKEQTATGIGRKDECRDEHEGGDGSENGSGNGRKNGDENRKEIGGGREPGNYGVVIEVDRKTREGGRRQRVTSNRSPKTRRPSKTVVPY